MKLFIESKGEVLSSLSNRMEYVSSLTIIHENGYYEEFPATLSNATISAANSWIAEGYTMITPEEGKEIINSIRDNRA